jgi:tetratricopeptide (TPR) repeat protein
MSLTSMFGLFGSAKRGSEKDDDSEIRSVPRVDYGFTADTFHDAFERGDYDLALRSVDAIKHRGKETAEYCYYRGCVLMQLGRNDEAAEWLQKNVDLETQPGLRARGFSAQGQLLMQQRRYDEAIRCFYSGLELCPSKACLHRDLAEASLRRGDEPSSALSMARKAVESSSHPGGLEDGMGLGENLATLAWILAAAEGDETEIEACVKRAVPIAREKRVATLAQVHYHSGLAFATLGDRGRSMRHFEEAVLVDPKGLWGRGARMMAHGMSKAG